MNPKDIWQLFQSMLDAPDEAAGHAKVDLNSAMAAGTSSEWSEEAQQELWEAFRQWVSHPKFESGEGQLRTLVLNALCALTEVPEMQQQAWEIIGSLAREFGFQKQSDMRPALQAAIFEIIAQPPEHGESVRRLFLLAGDSESRWAVFSAYEKYPWRLRPHARKYSDGSVSDADCDAWLIDQGLGADEYLFAD